MNDSVNHPAHYRKPGRKECIEEMLERFGLVAVYWFSVLSAYKYRYRAGDKDGNSEEQDLAKAEWYDRKADEIRACFDLDVWFPCEAAMPKTGQLPNLPETFTENEPEDNKPETSNRTGKEVADWIQGRWQGK